jgi:uncharacterized membrane protein YqiK
VRENVIEPAMKAACQNEGAKYGAKDLIQGKTRSQFQDDLSAALEKQVAARNIHVLLALIRNIASRTTRARIRPKACSRRSSAPTSRSSARSPTSRRRKRLSSRPSLEQAKKLVDVARQTVDSETNVKVANILADGQKQAAEIAPARAGCEQRRASDRPARRPAHQILGKAGADVERMKREAEAKGAKLMIDAFGTPQAYNQYIFAKNFEPQDLRLIFAGPGTFWTDLKTFEQVGRQRSSRSRREPQPSPSR